MTAERLCPTVRSVIEPEPESASPPTESSQIRKKGLGAGESQQNPTERLPPLGPVTDQILPRKIRREGLQDGMIEVDQVLRCFVSRRDATTGVGPPT